MGRKLPKVSFVLKKLPMLKFCTSCIACKIEIRNIHIKPQELSDFFTDKKMGKYGPRVSRLLKHLLLLFIRDDDLKLQDFSSSLSKGEAEE
jgi:hypothetical protein